MVRGTAAAIVMVGLASGALALWSHSAAARGGHFGGGFGGGGMRFGGGHFGGGGMRFGGAPFGGMRFGGGGMRFGGGGMRFGGGGMRFGGGGMRFGGAPFAGGPRFGGMAGSRFSPRFGRAPFPGMRFGGMGARGSQVFSNGNRAIARPNPGGLTAQRGFAASRLTGANTRFTGSNGVRAATAGIAGARLWHGQAGAAGARAFLHQGGFRHNAFASKVAWNTWGFRRHGCCGWFGKIFWPFVVGDVFTAVLWPWPWYEPFWGYGGDYALSNVLWVGPAATPTSYSNTPIYDIYGTGAGRAAGAPGGGGAVADAPAAADLAQACAELAPGVADLPIGDIERTVGPTGDQSAALNTLKTAWGGAIKLIKASCSGEVPLTPVRRLDVVEERLKAVLRALQLVSAPLENFHNSLSQAQQQSFDSMTAAARERNETAAGPAGRLTALCSERATSFSRLPLDKIVDAIRPTEPQRLALDALKSASARASEGLNASCPAQAPQSLPDRLRTVEQRLAAMISALQTVRPALIDFYRSLSDEQKARFNLMGQTLTQGSNDQDGRQGSAN